ncbi:MAG TPA: PQQ-dependent dehydrogenase, methanol/ethanol family [Steroidobacteraceae bacterium]|nr:PQQ-dependent dehydrogenase, methanol/ethanol family [Steroidobacteraceae bacterium]
MFRPLTLALTALAGASAVQPLDARAAGETRAAWVTESRLIEPSAEPQNWLTTGHDYADTRFSSLREINDGNVHRLALAWYYDLDTHRGQEATPVVVDGLMYTTSAWSKVQAFEAASGRLLWQFDPKVPGRTAVHACCDVVNRGVAVWRGRVYVATLDGRLIALDAHTGKPTWSVLTVDPHDPYTITGAPLAVSGRIVIGNAGSEYGVRGYVSAYDAVTGKLLWRFYTVPGDPAKGFENALLARAAKTWPPNWWKSGGGATVWNSFSYDPALDLLYFGTGNVQPWGRMPSGERADALLCAAIVAVHASSGRYAWHYQTTPGDMWDYDSTQTLTLATLKIDGRPRKVIMQAAKNGYFYVLDRVTGQLLSARNFVPVNWAHGVDPETGVPQVNPEALYDQTGKVWVGQPGAGGAHNWQPMSFSPVTGLVYIPAQELPFPYLIDRDFKPEKLATNMGIDQATTSLPQNPAVKAQALAGLKGYLSAWDPVAEREVWRAEYKGPWNGGVLSTAGNLVFQGSAAGDFVAYRASDGERLWSFPAQTGIIAAPMTFAVGGKQYVSVLAGWGGVFPLVTGALAFKSGPVVNRSRVLTFVLDGAAQLPPAQTLPVAFPAPPSAPVSAALAAEGAKQYARRCGSCHGDAAVSGGLVPDLRYSAALSSDALWKAVVDRGALESQGMVSFGSELSAHEQAAVRAYLIKRAQEDYARLHGVGTPLPARSGSGS